MTRETRLVVILVVFGAAGVTALAFVAHQYERALASRKEAPAAARPDRSDATPAAAMPLVEAFVAVREAVSAAAARAGVRPEDRNFGEEALAACRIARLSAGAAHGIDDDTYVRLSDAWRAWSRGEPVEAPLRDAFEARRPATSRENLGRYDALDAAIKR